MQDNSLNKGFNLWTLRLGRFLGHSGFRVNKLRPLDGLNIRLPIQIPIKGRGFISQGFGLDDPIYECCLKGFWSQPGRPGRTAKGFCKGLLA